MRVDYIIVDLKDTWQFLAFASLAILFLLSGYILMSYGIPLLMSGTWYLILFVIFTLCITLGTFILLIFFSRYHIILDDMWVQKTGFSITQFSLDRLDRIHANPTRITLYHNDQSISIGIWHSNYPEAMAILKNE